MEYDCCSIEKHQSYSCATVTKFVKLLKPTNLSIVYQRLINRACVFKVTHDVNNEYKQTQA